MNDQLRSVHPRPDMMRDTFLSLDGQWDFAFDDANEGLQGGWHLPAHALGGTITVPFCYQSAASGIGPTDEIHPVLWYRRSFTVPAEMKGQRIFLRFGAVDYRARVYVNGAMAGEHEGGYLPFAMDVTHLLKEGENDLRLRVEDAPDVTQPRGKQYWQRGLMGCWYTPISGIWQTVYLEGVGEIGIQQIHVTPNIDRHLASVEIALDQLPAAPMTLELTVSFENQPLRTVTVSTTGRVTRVPIDMIVHAGMDSVHLWSPERPNLYDLQARLLDGERVIDTVATYFGMRKVSMRNGQVLLNNEPIYQRLVLDQGYWPDTLLTPPSGEALRRDIEATLALGYNGARKHQKIEDPRYYYWADRLGLLVWGEVPSAYDYTDLTVRNLSETLLGFIDRDFNHPCIIAWVPLNESWGVPQIACDQRQQDTARMLCAMTKAQDGTRLCSSNDGWEQVEGGICALHDYAATYEDIRQHFASRQQVEQSACDRRLTYASTAKPTGDEPFLITEYGGIAFSTLGAQGNLGGMETWGYHDKVGDEEAFFARFKAVTDAIRELPYCQGYCYTQLTDVMQEINGALTEDRRFKVDVHRFAAINRNPVGR